MPVAGAHFANLLAPFPD